MKWIIDHLVRVYGIDRNTSTTLVITIIIFLLGLFISWFTSAMLTSIKRRHYRKSLKLVLKDFIVSCKKQYDAYQLFIEQKGFMYGEDYTIFQVSNFSINYLSNLDISIFTSNFFSIVKRRNPKRISKLFELIALVRTEYDSFQRNTNLLMGNLSKYQELYNANLDTIRKYHDDIVAAVHDKSIEINQAKYIQSLIDIFSEWRNKGSNKRINVTYAELVEKVYDISKSLPLGQANRPVIDCCIECNTAIVNMKKLHELMIETVKHSQFIFLKSFKLGNLIIKKL